jgi:type I restriction enzyme, S subunit
MIADLSPYSSYKSSSCDWLGNVPAHWTILPNRALFAEVKDRDHENEEMLSVTIAKGIVRQKVLLEGGAKRDSSNSDKSSYKLVQPRDIAYNKMRAWQGAVGASVLRGIVSPAYVVMRLRNADNSEGYFHYLFRTPQFAKEAERWSYGITSDMWSLRPEHFKMIYTPEPPPREQVAIARFLDWANRRLDRAISAKRKVIALLNEQKHAVIQRAVTRGLDLSVLLKPSGVPWLGEIPQHWGTIRSKWIFGSQKALALPDDVQLSATQAYGVIPQAEFEEKVGRRVVKISMHLEKRRHVEKDDFIISMRSFQGGLERAWASGAIRSSYVVLRKSPAVDTDVGFFSYLFKSRGYIRALQATGDFIRDGQDLNFTNFCRVDLPLIPGDEQRAIAKSIADSTRGLDSGLSRLGREIELLREYRTRLVADVVTGKIDVSEAAVRLPDEAALDRADGDADVADEIEIVDEQAVV